MKKNYWSLFLCLAMLATTFTLTSCDKDDVGSSSDLIGTWKLVRMQGYEIYDGDEDSWDYDEDELDFVERIIFKKNGTGSWISEGHEDFEYEGDEGEVDEEKFEYTFKDNKLKMHFDDSYIETFKVVKLTSSELVFEYREKDDDGDEYSEKFYFKKIKK